MIVLFIFPHLSKVFILKNKLIQGPLFCALFMIFKIHFLTRSAFPEAFSFPVSCEAV